VRSYRATRILRIEREVADLDVSEAFYRDALGFVATGRGARQRTMRLGGDTIALVRRESRSRSVPAACNDLWFQHLAIVVGDMDAACRHLMEFGPVPISAHGPSLLPPSNGSVRAFKFRDPDGHPLELIWFPPGQGRAVWQAGGGLFRGIDHSAISAAGTWRSAVFYGRLGLRVTARSCNHGPAQDALDGIAPARVRVTGIRPASADGPGLELLAYRPPGRRGPARMTDRVAIEVRTLFGPRCRQVRDPDGHRLLLVAQGTGVPA
jgi:catechol 2,3-dioxygenase-like lactoylglutathione lyase family enzyme